MNKIYKYSTCHSFKYKGKEYTMQSQLYQIGVYVICNNDPAEQFSQSPNQMIILEKKLVKAEKDGEITDLVFSAPIRVQKDENGLWVRI